MHFVIQDIKNNGNSKKVYISLVFEPLQVRRKQIFISTQIHN